jgi:AcrR family transcriptional regulator
MLMYAKSETTIANILQAAQKLFLARSYAEVTMADIAVAAEVTKGALYHHFAGKEALYLAMMLAEMAEKQALMTETVDSKGSCYERLYRLTLNFFNLPDEKRKIMKLVRRDINIFKDPMRNSLIRAYQAALPNQVETIIRDGIEAGELIEADPRLLAWQYVAMVEVVLTDYAQQTLGNREDMADYVLSLFFKGAGQHTEAPNNREVLATPQIISEQAE